MVRHAIRTGLRTPRERHDHCGWRAVGSAGRTGAAATPRVSRDCREQLNTNTFQYIDRIENRRVFAADPQTGLVMGCHTSVTR